MLLLLLLLAGPVICLLYGFNIVSRWRMRHVPGPRPSWLMGNVLQMGPPGKSHDAMQRWATEYGPVYRYFLGRRPCVVISDPELVRQVSVKRFINYHDRSLPLLQFGSACDSMFQNSGILFARGKYWLGIRTACEPLFHTAALASYAPMMNRAVDQLLDKLQTGSHSGDGICVSELLKGMSMDVIGDTAFGVDFKAQKEGSSSRLVESAEAMFAPFAGMPFLTAALSFAVPDLGWLWYRFALIISPKTVQKTVSGRRYIWGASQALLDSARKQGADSAAGTGQPTGIGAGVTRVGKGGKGAAESVAKAAEQSAAFQQASKAMAGQVPPESSIVSRLKDAVNKQTGERLSDLDVCAQLFTFLLAGYETTSVALSFSLYLLALHPEHQQRVMQEVDAFGGRELGYADLASCPYIEAVFQESMRLYPPVSALLALAREPKQGGVDLVLGDGSTMHLPDACRVMFNIWTLHRDERYWPEPTAFKPDRFLPSTPSGKVEASANHSGSYFPFGLGPRKCIGWRFAMEEGVLCLARIFQRFEIRLDTERHQRPLDLRSSVTLNPEGGIWIRVTERKQGSVL
ncbi:Cytochrome P450 3A12 [Chlorella vulgaris]